MTSQNTFSQMGKGTVVNLDARSPIYQALPFVFNLIFEATCHVVFVVPLLVNSGVSKTRLISWQNLVFLPLRLAISVKKMQGVTGRISQMVWAGFFRIAITRKSLSDFLFF